MVDCPDGENIALFLDRDGVINVDHGYTHKVQDLHFIPGILDLIELANVNGYLVIVVTNQAGVARGFYTEDAVVAFNNAVSLAAAEAGCKVERFYYCPHHPDGLLSRYKKKCSYRKPGAGMLLRAAADYSIDLSSSIIIGDKTTDIEAGRKANLRAGYLFNPEMRLVSEVLTEGGFNSVMVKNFETVANIEGW